MKSHDRYNLRSFIEELKKVLVGHEELLSIYSAPDQDIGHLLRDLCNRKEDAASIRSETARKNVTEALEKAVERIRVYDRMPEKGLAVFAGNVSVNEGTANVKVWSFEPPEPVKEGHYSCAKSFVTTPLEEMLSDGEVYGIIVIDNNESTLALLSGESHKVIRKLSSGYHGKHHAGGWSQARFEHIIENESRNFLKRTAQHAAEEFLPRLKDLKGIIIGGPSMTKDEYASGDYMHHELKRRIIAVKETCCTGEQGVRDLIDKTKDTIREIITGRQKKLMHRFISELQSEGKYAYGPDAVNAIKTGAVEILLVSDKVSLEEADPLYKQTMESGTEIEIIQSNFEEGKQLWDTFGGKAALLRYKV